MIEISVNGENRIADIVQHEALAFALIFCPFDAAVSGSQRLRIMNLQNCHSIFSPSGRLRAAFVQIKSLFYYEKPPFTLFEYDEIGKIPYIDIVCIYKEV